MVHEKLKALRKAKGLTQSEVAETLHISPNTYSMIECGKTKLDTERVLALCKFYDIIPEELFNSGVSFTFNDKVENRYATYIQTLHADNQETIALLKEQINMMKEQLLLLQQTISLLINKP